MREHFERAATWQFLSLLVQPPDPSVLARLRPLHEELTLDQRDQTADLLAALDAPHAETDLEDAYHRLLGSVGACPPCESAYQAPGTATAWSGCRPASICRYTGSTMPATLPAGSCSKTLRSITCSPVNTPRTASSGRPAESSPGNARSSPLAAATTCG